MRILLPTARNGSFIISAMQEAGTFDDPPVRDAFFLSTTAEMCSWRTETFSPVIVAPREKVPHPAMLGVRVSYQYSMRKWWGIFGKFELHADFERPFITLLPLAVHEQHFAVEIEAQLLNLMGGRRSSRYREWITDPADPLFRNAVPFFEKIKKRFLANCKGL